MCLDYKGLKTFSGDAVSMTPILAWKVMSKTERGGVRTGWDYKPRRPGMWHRASGGNITAWGSVTHKEYEAGFHAFTTKEEAIKYGGDASNIVPVLVRGVVATGNQSGKGAVVAREMFIIKDWEKII